MIYVSAKQLAGTVAMWAIRQSPYKIPDHLDKIVVALQDKFEPDASGFDFRMYESGDALLAYVRDTLRSVPEYVAWNNRKNGNPAPFQFSSRYDGAGDPDNDFIDLDALEMNVARSIAAEY